MMATQINSKNTKIQKTKEKTNAIFNSKSDT